MCTLLLDNIVKAYYYCKYITYYVYDLLGIGSSDPYRTHTEHMNLDI